MIITRALILSSYSDAAAVNFRLGLIVRRGVARLCQKIFSRDDVDVPFASTNGIPHLPMHAATIDGCFDQIDSAATHAFYGQDGRVADGDAVNNPAFVDLGKPHSRAEGFAADRVVNLSKVHVEPATVRIRIGLVAPLH